MIPLVERFESPRPARALVGAGLILALSGAVACSRAHPEAPGTEQPTEDADAGSAGEGDAGADVTVTPEDPPNFTDIDAGLFLCNPYSTWSAGKPAAGIATAPGTKVIGLTITPDELGAAWIEDAAGSYTYRFADRSDVASPFGTARTITIDTDEYYDEAVALPGGISLSPDGLRIVFVKADKRGFLSASRADRSATFGAPNDLEFQTINKWVKSLSANVADPAYGSNGTTFLYSMFKSSATIAESRSVVPFGGGAAVWPAGAPHGEAPLGAIVLPGADGGPMTTLYRHPISLSSDGLTMFITDEYPEAPPTARAVFRTSIDEKFVISASLGNWRAVQPSTSCARLYFIEDDSVRFSDKE